MNILRPIKTAGAYRNKQRLVISGISENIRTVIDQLSTGKGVTLELLNDLDMPGYIESGSIALKICRIADDTADLFFKAMEPRIGTWRPRS